MLKVLVFALLPAILFASFLFLKWVTTTSDDALEVNIIKDFSRLLLKNIPGYAATLRADHSSGSFKFCQIKLQGRFTVTEEDVNTFDTAVRSPNSPFLLVAKTTPLLIRLLADRRCPIRPIGSVNTRNVISFLRPNLCTASKVKGRELEYKASFGSIPGIRRKRGVEVAVVIQIFSAGEVILELEIWILQFLPSSFEPRFTGSGKDEKVVDGSHLCSLDLSSSDPLKWAASCKDYNPIHVSSIGARLFGFKSVIAHGNQVAALALQQLHTDAHSPFTVEAEFIRPVLLPTKLDVLLQERPNSTQTLSVLGYRQKKLHTVLTIKSSAQLGVNT